MGMIRMIYRKLRVQYHKAQFFFSINWFKTFYFNYKMFPFDIAKQLPVYFYGKVKFGSLTGKIKIEAPIKKGMIGFGQRFEKMTISRGSAEFILDGTLVFKGHAHF